MATSPTSGPGGGGGGDLAATLALGDDAAGAGMDNLGDSTMNGGSWIFDGDNEEYPRGTGTEAGETGGSAGSLYFAPSTDEDGADTSLRAGSGQTTGDAGGHALLAGGSAANGNPGAYVRANGSDTLTVGRISVQTDGSAGAVGEALVSDGADVLYSDLGGIKLATHAAPADGVLAAGELYFWFDQTNGAAKLMVKAKQADGTVKTAAIALA